MIDKLLESLRPLEKKAVDYGNYQERYNHLAYFVKWNFDNVIKTNQKKFLVTEHNRKIIDLLLWYFSEHPYFLKEENKTRKGAENYEFDKSILLVGPIGCGKTDIMIAIMKSIAILVSHPDINEEEKRFWREKDFSIDFCVEFDARFALESYAMMNKFKAKKNFLLDDLGHDDGSSSYSNKNVLAAGEILMLRYNMSKFNDCKTHYTTNLYMESQDTNQVTISSKYGDREKNRFFETHNLIYFPNDSPSLRKKI